MVQYMSDLQNTHEKEPTYCGNSRSTHKRSSIRIVIERLLRLDDTSLNLLLVQIVQPWKHRICKQFLSLRLGYGLRPALQQEVVNVL